MTGCDWSLESIGLSARKEFGNFWAVSYKPLMDRNAPASSGIFWGRTMNKFLVTASAVAAAALLASAPAHAVTFASFSPTSSSANISLTSGDLASVEQSVWFQYLTPVMGAFGQLQATLTLDATQTAASVTGSTISATFDSGTFEFDYAGSTAITMGSTTINPGDVLLSGSFDGALFSAQKNGSSGGVADSILGGGNVSFDNNNFLTFNNLTDEGFSISMTSGKPAFKVISGSLRDFSAVASGTFSADIIHEGGGGVPEPASWALMILGIGAVGFGVRSRARAATV